MEEVQEVVVKVLMGFEKRSRVYIEKEKKFIVYYEVGYVIVCIMIFDFEFVYEVLIILRGYVGGYIMYFLKEDKFYVLKFDMM